MVELNDIVTRLAQLGYQATDEDYQAIEFTLNQVVDYTLNYCNITKVPEIVELRMIDRVCADFLFNKKNSGGLEGFNYDNVIKSIKEGDTTLTYAVGQGEDTPENRFDAFVKKLERGYDKWITPHRCVRWT